MSRKLKIEPIESTERLYAKVARRVADLVSRGEIKAGERLPSERDLAEMLKVSRPTIREAMIALEVSGVIDVRTGSGIYVAQTQQPLAQADEGIGPFEIFEMRLLVEPEACALAAERMTLEQLQEVLAIYAEMEKTDKTPDMEAVDGRFHTAIARGTENAALASTVEWLWALRVQSGQSKGFHRLILDEGTYPALNEHGAIVAALEARDPVAARRAMREHLEASISAAARHFGEDAES